MKYPYLPIGKVISYVSEENIFMSEAKKIRDNQSTDKFHPTGAVLVKNNEIIGSSANKSKLSNKSLLKIHGNGLCLRRLFKVKSGTKYWLCPGCADYEYHAEFGAVQDALLNSNYDVHDSDLYLYGHWWCCKPCWDKMIKNGIRNVFLVENAKELFGCGNK
jgi:deoxycytidylate deaminase